MTSTEHRCKTGALTSLFSLHVNIKILSCIVRCIQQAPTAIISDNNIVFFFIL
uniref:Uncharacterized protein n=1 Tax=Anguilla anguilla TaxID=7936 RepID=A0A0E9PWY3_ANGAN